MAFKNEDERVKVPDMKGDKRGFKDENGSSLINEEQKLRIPLSDKAKMVMKEDMELFGVSKESRFINTVFCNFKEMAKSSIAFSLQQKKLELDRLLAKTQVDRENKRKVIECLLIEEEVRMKKKLSEFEKPTDYGKLYHIDKKNLEYLTESCEEIRHYERPKLYLRYIIEEYCSLPFIERERIYRKEVFEQVELACRESRTLKVENYDMQGKKQQFYVYPYKILPDPFRTRSYLVGYSRKIDRDEQDKVIASFAMSRLTVLHVLNKSFHLNKKEISKLDTSLSKNSPAYLIGTPEEIKVKLSPEGKRIYQTKLFSRPERIRNSSSADDLYVFHCTRRQAYNYFFSFGPEIEVISPTELREEFIEKLSASLKIYTKIAKQDN